MKHMRLDGSFSWMFGSVDWWGRCKGKERKKKERKKKGKAKERKFLEKENKSYGQKGGKSSAGGTSKISTPIFGHSSAKTPIS